MGKGLMRSPYSIESVMKWTEPSTCIRLAASRTACTTGVSRLTRIPMITVTTNISTNVQAQIRCCRLVIHIIQIVVANLLIATVSAIAEVVAQFPGPSGNGLFSNELPSDRDGVCNVKWAVNMPAGGWSSPVSSRGRIYVTTAVEEGDSEQKGFGAGIQSMGDFFRSKATDKPSSFELPCLNESDGGPMNQSASPAAKDAINKSMFRNGRKKRILTFELLGDFRLISTDCDNQLLGI